MTADKATGGTEATKVESTKVMEEKQSTVTQGKETEKLSVSVAAVEKEANKILDAARIKSTDILIKSREEVNRITSASLELGEVESEREKIIKVAQDEATHKLKNSKAEASRIRENIGDKETSIVKRLVEMVTGTGAK